jgi:hypothetical protein
MTGPEHYKEAERLLPLAHDLADQGHQVRADFIVARAQVHATLALAAATAAAQATAYDGDEHSSRARGWAGVA